MKATRFYSNDIAVFCELLWKYVSKFEGVDMYSVKDWGMSMYIYPYIKPVSGRSYIRVVDMAVDMEVWYAPTNEIIKTILIPAYLAYKSDIKVQGIRTKATINFKPYIFTAIKESKLAIGTSVKELQGGRKGTIVQVQRALSGRPLYVVQINGTDISDSYLAEDLELIK